MDTMDGRLRKNGEIETVSLGTLVDQPLLDDILLGFVHRGSVEANVWVRKTQALQLAEAREIAKIIRDEDAETLEIAYGPARDELEGIRRAIVEELEKEGKDVPAKYDSPISLRQVVKGPDADEAFREMQRECVSTFLVKAEGPGFSADASDVAAHVKEIERLGCLLHVYKKAMMVQRLDAEGFSPAKSVGGDGQGIDPEPVAGTGDD